MPDYLFPERLRRRLRFLIDLDTAGQLTGAQRREMYALMETYNRAEEQAAHYSQASECAALLESDCGPSDAAW